MEGIKSGSLDPEIEALRKSMQKNQSEITGMDFGSGTNYAGVRKVSKIARKGISSPKTCLLLSYLLKSQRPQIIIELGTSLGITTAYLSRSMAEGKIYSFEGNADLCEEATKIWEQLKCENISLINGNIDQTLSETLETYTKSRFCHYRC